MMDLDHSRLVRAVAKMEAKGVAKGAIGWWGRWR